MYHNGTEARANRRKVDKEEGLVLVDRFGKKINLANRLYREFGRPGSNRGIVASEYVLTLTQMLIDGAMHLEDVRDFENDEAYKIMTGHGHYPTSDAIGDWLRRDGTTDGEKKLMNAGSELTNSLTKGIGLTLDIDATVIEAEKGDANYTYEDVRGYQPLLAACVELGLFVNTRFQHGNVNTQGDLVPS